MTHKGSKHFSTYLQAIVLILLGRVLLLLTVFGWLASFFARSFQAEELGGPTPSPFPGLLPLTALLIVGSIGLWCVRRGKKLKIPSAKDLLANDPRAPVLYLRSFGADGAEIPSTANGQPLSMYGVMLESPTEEEDLAKVFSRIGPFIAIGNPDEKLPELGASRMYVSHENWQTEVHKLMAEAQLIVLRAGVSEGFLWELQSITKVCDPKRAVLYLPFLPIPAHQKKKKNPPEDPYQEFRSKANARLPHPLPEERGTARFITFQDDWTPQALEGRSGPRAEISVTGSQALAKQRELIPVFERLGINTKPFQRSILRSLLRILLATVVIVGGLILVLVLTIYLTTRSETDELMEEAEEADWEESYGSIDFEGSREFDYSGLSEER